MSGQTSRELKLEIAHVLFIDIVGYSKLLHNEQSEVLRELNDIVRSTEQFRAADAAGALLRLPTGDGVALIFRNSPEAPAQCALEIAEALKSRSRFQLRMGIHSGPVNEVTDVNERANFAGAGINIAQRVMDCGDAGHILLSKHVAEDLEHHERWRPHLHAEAGRGRQDEARQLLDQITEAARTRYVPAYTFAVIHLALGEKDEALDWLEKNARDHASPVTNLITVDPYLDPLRGDPRFKKLVSAILSGSIK